MSKQAKPTDMTPSWKLVDPSIDLLKKYFVPVLYAGILPSLILTLGSLLARDLTHIDAKTSIGIVLMLVGGLASLLSVAAYLYLQLQAVAGKHVSVPDMYKKSFPYLLRIIGYSIVFTLLVTVGLFLLIVPGLIFFRRYYLGTYYIIDQNLTIREALRRSAAESKPVAGYIWGVLGVTLVFTLASAIISGILRGITGDAIAGLLGNVVVYLCIFLPALRYREVVKHAATPAAQPAAS